jgi:type I restriction enzyme S subunit
MKSEIPPDWRMQRIDSLAKVVTGATPKAANPEYFGKAVPFLTPSDIPGGQRQVETNRFLSQAGAAAFEGKLVSKGTPCFVAIGSTIGKTCVAPAQTLTNQQIHATIPNPSVADRHFLYYALTAYAGEMRQIAGGSATPILKKSAFERFELPVPPLVEQRSIGCILGSLDDKIESNRRLAKTLEEIVATQFKARFVDFVDRDDLIESEIGLVPRGWSVGELRDVAKITMGHSPPSRTYCEDPLEGPPLVQGKGAFGHRFPDISIYCNDPIRTALRGDLLLTVRAPVGEINICTGETCLGRGVAGIASSTPGFVELSLRCGESRWRARESGTIYPSVNKRQVEDFPLVLPPEDILNDFETAVRPVRSAIASLHKESGTLSRLLEVLLPRLVSGKLRISTADGAGS